jgi:hypothetical protein
MCPLVCELLEWKRPGGGLKNHECRQLLERLEAEGFLTLPELRKLGGRGPRRADLSTPYFEPALVECAAGECEPLELALVEANWRAVDQAAWPRSKIHPARRAAVPPPQSTVSRK